MHKKGINKFQSLLINLNTHKRKIFLAIVAISIPIVYLIVYESGGTRLPYTHLMYIVIVFASITLGSRWGLLAGVIGGIILGPFMPSNVITNEQQLFFHWFFRLAMFTLIGLFSGFSSGSLRKSFETISNLYSHNQDTGIPNLNNFKDNKVNINERRTVITILVNNHDNVVDLLGVDIYNKLLKKIYHTLKSHLDDDSIVVQADSNKLWISKKFEDMHRDAYLLCNILKEPLKIEDIPLYVEFSLGISSVENSKRCYYPEAYKHSDISARHAQKNNLPYAIFDERQLKKRGDFELLGIFPSALRDNQTKLVYQPKIDLRTNKPIGIEALIRWEHPIRGLILPDAFIPLVEETQLIHHLTDWVLREAIKKIKEFKKENIDVNVSINISAKNLFDNRFFDHVMNIVTEEKISPKQIEFEITESVLMNNPEETKILLQRLIDHQFVISLDDFGKGYSSLAYLSEFPIQVVKIDKYFMSQIDRDESVLHIVKATIDLAHKLGYSVVAEGIEAESVAQIAKNLDCDYAQGYYFAKPLFDTEIISWYKEKIKSDKSFA